MIVTVSCTSSGLNSYLPVTRPMNRLAAGALQRFGFQALKHPQVRGGGGGYPGGSFWSEGTQSGRNGFLFGEVPPAAGLERKRLWWEPYWYVGYGGFFLAVYLIYHAKPLEALDIKYWAKPRASDELAMEMRMLDKLQASSELQERMKAVCSQLNLVEDEMYDLVLMRNEYKVKLGMHTGRVPADLADIFDELAAA